MERLACVYMPLQYFLAGSILGVFVHISGRNDRYGEDMFSLVAWPIRGRFGPGFLRGLTTCTEYVNAYYRGHGLHFMHKLYFHKICVLVNEHVFFIKVRGRTICFLVVGPTTSL